MSTVSRRVERYMLCTLLLVAIGNAHAVPKTRGSLELVLGETSYTLEADNCDIRFNGRSLVLAARGMNADGDAFRFEVASMLGDAPLRGRFSLDIAGQPSWHQVDDPLDALGVDAQFSLSDDELEVLENSDDAAFANATMTIDETDALTFVSKHDNQVQISATSWRINGIAVRRDDHNADNAATRVDLTFSGRCRVVSQSGGG